MLKNRKAEEGTIERALQIKRSKIRYAQEKKLDMREKYITNLEYVCTLALKYGVDSKQYKYALVGLRKHLDNYNKAIAYEYDMKQIDYKEFM